MEGAITRDFWLIVTIVLLNLRILVKILTISLILTGVREPDVSYL
jgi:hypothetical protein